MGTPEDKSATSTKSNDNVDSKPEVDWEKRFKDTQASYTKSQQKLKELEAKAQVLEQLTTPQVEIDSETKERLEALKYDNPDAWRDEMNRLESEAAKKHQETLNEVTTQAQLQAELERRAQVLEEFNRSHQTPITDEVIQYDVPPRITKKLEDGSISFEAYLEEVHNYLNTPKVIGDGNKTLNQPDLTKTGGDSTPTKGAVDIDIAKDYADMVF